MTVIEDQIRLVLSSQADAMSVPDSTHDDQQLARVIEMPTRRRTSKVWLVAAAVALVTASGVALAQHRGEAPAAANTSASASFHRR